MSGKQQRQGALVDSSVSGDAVTVGTGAAGIADFFNWNSTNILDPIGFGGKGGWNPSGVGGSGVSSGLSILGGLNTFLTHDAASTDEAAAYGERTAMGAIDTAWGLGGGPAAVLDAVTGGNTSGLLKGGAGAFISMGNMLTEGVDNQASANFSEDVTSGKYGGAAGAVGIFGDTLAQWANMAVSEGDQEFDTSAMENFSENMQNGSEWNPLTHASRFGDWLGGATYDLFNDY